MLTPRAVCEFPAGLAAVSLRLHGGRHCRPPISRMGNKQGYAEVILDALGLRSVTLVEPDVVANVIVRLTEGSE